MSNLECSVIVPSYNRRASLEMVLEGLARQTVAGYRFEVIVVLDGSQDDSDKMLRRWQLENRLPNLRWHKQTNSGQAVARNRGVEMSQTPLVVFLDDDVVPEPDLISVHLDWHQREGGAIAVLGDCEIVREEKDSLYHLGVWAWWEDKYQFRALPGHSPGYRDFCTGNVSLRREDFLRTGGFDTGFRGYGGEDYELGYRLQKAGVRFISDRQARARHYHRSSVSGVLRATRQEAHGDVLLGAKHPELRTGLRLIWIPEGGFGKLVRLALYAPWLGDRMMGLAQRVLPWLESRQLRWPWLTLFSYLRFYAYWRGVRDALGSEGEILCYQDDSLPLSEQTLDISQGIPPELPPIFVDGPSRLTITFRGQELGQIRLHKHIEESLPEYLSEQIARQLGQRLWLRLSEEAKPPVILKQNRLEQLAESRNHAKK